MRTEFLPYCLPFIGEEEVNEVADSIRSGWVTTGPKVRRFEEAFAAYVDVPQAVAVSSCTAALHLSLAAGGIGPGDEVIVPVMTFCATANVVCHTGAVPVLVDTDEHGLIDPEGIRRAITPRTRAVMPVHYAGQACDLDAILEIAGRHGLAVIEDAAHAAGASYRGRKIGRHGRTVSFSFYATKNMTTGEGGMITTNDSGLADRMRRLALHGMTRDAWKRYSQAGSWYYEVQEAGFKYNMTDIQAGIGIHQLQRLDGFIRRRREIAAAYREAFSEFPEVTLPAELPDRDHIYHLYPVRLSIDRAAFIEELKARRIGASVHFIPLHRHPRYQRDPREFPVADQLYQGLVSLPLYPAMTDQDVGDVIAAVEDIIRTSAAPVFAGIGSATGRFPEASL